MVFTETYNNKYTGLDSSLYPQGLQYGVWALHMDVCHS